MDPDLKAREPNETEEMIRAVADICARRKITALDSLLESCRNFSRDEFLNVAVLGRFKAGKSSFLNHIFGRPLLPVGVVPVTSVITEIQWGPEDRVEVLYIDGRKESIPAGRIRDFVAETENPENRKHVARVRIELPSMERYRGIRFVDTPGLESVFEHNTEVSLGWLPNAGLALVAMGIDPPLSQRDLDLIRRLARFTPRISILLTKVDVVSDAERTEVLNFVRRQLERSGNTAVPVFPFSIREGFAGLREEIDERLLLRTQQAQNDQHRAILRHKLDTLLTECEAWLVVALRLAETADAQRKELRDRIIENQSVADVRQVMQLLVRRTQGDVRTSFEALLKQDELPVRRGIDEELDRKFPSWGSLATAVTQFEDWLQAALARQMSELSARHADAFPDSVRSVNRQLAQLLQDFRNRISARTLEALGVPLQTTEMELRVDAPALPDIRIGRIFDRSWELLSWLIPMPLARGVVRRHFHAKVERLVYTNLSRLASQWEEAIHAALAASGKEAVRRLDQLVSSVRELTESGGADAAGIRADIATLARFRDAAR